MFAMFRLIFECSYLENITSTRASSQPEITKAISSTAVMEASSSLTILPQVTEAYSAPSVAQLNDEE